MKTTKLTLILITVMVIAACNHSKKSTKSKAADSASIAVAPSVAPSAATTTSTNTYLFAKSPNGIYAPGNEELTAIQLKYKDATIDQLKEGHVLYTKGACINCHGPKDIYKREEARWKDIIDNMAQKANISDAEKDAVYKYVLAIKATQPK